MDVDLDVRRRKFERKRDDARRHLEENIATVRRAANLVGKWQRRVRYLESQISKTADDLAAERARGEERKLARVPKPRRPRLIGQED